MGHHTEILAPAGSVESLRAGLLAGADAFYVGGSRFGARAYAQNFTEEQLLEAIDEVHLHGKKIYMTVNTLLKDGEIKELFSYLLPYYERGLDAVIVQDVGVLRLIREYFPDMEIHASTQMSISALEGARFLKKQGVTRVVPSRELGLKEIAKMKNAGVELECFVHGAMCYSYSGQCLFSSLIGGRSGNRGQCAQPCRLSYRVGNEKEKDVLSLKDLCTIHKIPDLIEAGIDSFKIEGRMKQPEYVYTVVSLYRKYTGLYEKVGREGFFVSKEDERRLKEVYQRRGYSEGYYHQRNGREMISFAKPKEAAKDHGKNALPNPWEEAPPALPVSGRLLLKVEQPGRLEMNGGGTGIFCEGEVVQEALRQPLDVSKVEKQMKKTGNTGFYFQDLDIQMEGRVFLPVQSLNQLRREGLEALKNSILKAHRRRWMEAVDRNETEEKDACNSTRAEEENTMTGTQNALEGNALEGIENIRTEEENTLAGTQDALAGNALEGRQNTRTEEENTMAGTQDALEGNALEGTQNVRTREENTLAGTQDALAGNTLAGTQNARTREENTLAETQNAPTGDIRMGVLVQTKEQLQVALHAEKVSEIYVEDMALFKEAKGLGKRVILALPHIFREDTAKKWERYFAEIQEDCSEILIRNWDSYQWLKDRGFEKNIRTDYNLYVWNQEGKAFFAEKGIRDYTVPVEFRERELKELGVEDASFIVYGYQPVMLTANCIQKTMYGCDRKEGYLYLTDRKQKKIPVKKCCDSCYNVVYNPSPLFLADFAKEIRCLGVGRIRLDFSVEGREEMEEVLKVYQEGFFEGKEVSPFQKDFTRGHWKRGVV